VLSVCAFSFWFFFIALRHVVCCSFLFIFVATDDWANNNVRYSLITTNNLIVVVRSRFDCRFRAVDFPSMCSYGTTEMPSNQSSQSSPLAVIWQGWTVRNTRRLSFHAFPSPLRTHCSRWPGNGVSPEMVLQTKSESIYRRTFFIVYWLMDVFDHLHPALIVITLLRWPPCYVAYSVLR